jgi:hypothetical protein
MKYIKHFLINFKNKAYSFILRSNERDPLGRLIKWIDKTVGKIKKFLGLKFSALKLIFFSTAQQKLFIFINDVMFFVKFCSYTLQFLTLVIKSLYLSIYHIKLNGHLKFLLYIILTALLMYFFGYLVYVYGPLLKGFLLNELFSFLRNFKNPLKGKDLAECMNHQPKPHAKPQTGPYDIYKTTNSIYGGFTPAANRAVQKAWDTQKTAINNFRTLPSIRRLSPGEENLLLKDPINETNVFKQDWPKDEPIFYCEQELAINEINRTIQPPLVYSGLGVFAAITPFKAKSSKLAACSGATSGGIGYYYSAAIDSALDKKNVAAGKAIIKHHGLRVENGFLVGGPEKLEKKI